MINKKYKIVSLFAGIGGIDLGFTMCSNKFEVIYSNEFDKSAVETYDINHSISAECRDITQIDEKDIPDHDILCAGFPCQAFSIAGKRLGFNDTRGTLFFDVARIIKAKKPRVVFLENVKNILTHDKGKTLDIILSTLKELGYQVHYKVLNALEYGIPQNRERIYIVGFKNLSDSENFIFPLKRHPYKEIKNIVDFDNKVADKYYYTSKSKIYDKIKEQVSEKYKIYQWRRKYVRKNNKGICPTLTANMGTGGHNVPLIYTDFGIRKLTPRECLRLQGFPDDFKIAVSDTQIYKQAGNSVCVNVIKEIASEILEAIDSRGKNG